MPATAAARRVASTAAPAPRVKRPARGGGARRSAARRGASRGRPAARASRPAGGQLIPLAVGRTAVAVRGLPELRLVHRLTQGQLWIAVLGALLAGIVGLNVVSLSLGASSGRVARQVDGLERQNSALRARLATRLSDQRVQDAAERLGLVVPAPGEIRYLTAGERYAAIAARRLGAGDFTVSSALAPVPVAPAPAIAPASPAPPATAPTQTAPAPAPGTPATTPPAPPTGPAAPAPAPAPTGGGVPTP